MAMANYLSTRVFTIHSYKIEAASANESLSMLPCAVAPEDVLPELDGGGCGPYMLYAADVAVNVEAALYPESGAGR